MADRQGGTSYDQRLADLDLLPLDRRRNQQNGMKILRSYAVCPALTQKAFQQDVNWRAGENDERLAKPQSWLLVRSQLLSIKIANMWTSWSRDLVIAV